MTDQEEIRRLRQLAIDLILIMPGYPGCGDFSREQRTYEDARRLLGKAMPENRSRLDNNRITVVGD